MRPTYRRTFSVAPIPRRVELFHVCFSHYRSFLSHAKLSLSEGEGRVTLFASSGQARTFNYQVSAFSNLMLKFGTSCVLRRLVMLVSKMGSLHYSH